MRRKHTIHFKKNMRFYACFHEQKVHYTRRNDHVFIRRESFYTRLIKSISFEWSHKHRIESLCLHSQCLHSRQLFQHRDESLFTVSHTIDPRALFELFFPLSLKVLRWVKMLSEREENNATASTVKDTC